MKEIILNLVPPSKMIDVLTVDTDQYVGNFERDLIDYLEDQGHRFMSIFDDHMCRPSRKTVFVDPPAGTAPNSLGLCLDFGSDMFTLEHDIRKFFTKYKYRHVSDESITKVNILSFRQMKAWVIEFD